MARIFIVMGKSATGKDTIYKQLLTSAELQLKTAVIYTTRPKRSAEREGVEYHFVDEAALLEFKAQNKIIEHRFYDTVHGRWHYFTVNDGQIDLDRFDYLMIGTLASYLQIRAYYGDEKVVPIYLEVEDGVRLLRAMDRERNQGVPKYAEVCRRYLADEEDFSEENLVKAGIVKRYCNHEMEECLHKIRQDIKNFTVNCRNNVI